jgi:hypothetical protein
MASGNENQKPNTEGTKTAIAIVASLIVGLFALILVSLGILPTWSYMLIIPVFSYIISILFSVIHQYTSCNKVEIGNIAKSDLIVFGTNLLVAVILFLEDFPFLKGMFGVYAPRNPITGLPYEEGTAEYMEAMRNENHYKIQFFSSIVKAVVPMYVNEQLKEGFVYLYWNFWATIMPFYFLLSVQGMC